MKQDLTYYLAMFWGVYLIIGSLVLLLFPNIKNQIFSIAKVDAYRLPLGVLLGVAGITHITFHNNWTDASVIIVSLFGWLLLIKGTMLIMYTSWNNLIDAYMKTKYLGFVYLFMISLGLFLIQSVNPVLKF